MGAQRLPPLNSLRAFEVAARRLSFKLAADELNITPTAVSHRIRVLEEWLGVRLFNRLTRALELTKEGEAYAARVHVGFEELIAASDSLRHSVDSGELVVATTMSFGSNWLPTRLLAFNEANEDFTVRIEASDALTDLARSNVDVAIRFGEGGYEDLHSHLLFTDLVTAVCTPELARGLARPRDLRERPLIAYTWPGYGPSDPSWGKWLAAAGEGGGEPPVAASVTEEHIALSQVLAGGGIGLMGLTACADALLAGRLVRPFPVALEDYGHYFACRPDLLARHKVRVFHDWIVDQAIAFDETTRADPRTSFETIVPRGEMS